MNATRMLIALAAIALVPAQAQQDKPAPAKTATPAERKADPAKDKPPAAEAKPAPRLNFLPRGGTGKSGRTEPGASRGPDARELAISVISAKETGLTSLAQPDLYWFVSRPVAGSAVLTIMPLGTNAIDPLFEGPLPPAPSAGMQRTSLADLKVTLMPDIEYDWSISIVTNAQSRSGDVMASGRIRYLAPAAALKASLDAANAEGRAEQFAANGYWYDVVDFLRRSAAGSALEISFYESAGLARVVKFLKEGN